VLLNAQARGRTRCFRHATTLLLAAADAVTAWTGRSNAEQPGRANPIGGLLRLWTRSDGDNRHSSHHHIATVWLCAGSKLASWVKATPISSLRVGARRLPRWWWRAGCRQTSMIHLLRRCDDCCGSMTTRRNLAGTLANRLALTRKAPSSSAPCGSCKRGAAVSSYSPSCRYLYLDALKLKRSVAFKTRRRGHCGAR